MNPIGKIEPRRVRLFKNVLHAVLEGLIKGGLEFELLEVAAAADEFAADVRKMSADKFKNSDDGPKTFPEWIGGE